MKSKMMGAFWLPTFETVGGEPVGGAGQGAAPVAEPPAATPGQPSQGAAGGAPAGAAPAPAATQPGQPAAEPMHEVTVNGQKIKVPLKELLSGYSRTKDYTQKQQQLAAERNSFKALVQAEARRLIQEQQQQGKNDEQELDPGQQALAEVRSLQQKQQDMRLDGILKQVAKAHPHVHEAVLLQEARRRGVTDDNLETILEIAEELAQNDGFDTRLESVISEGKHPTLLAWKQKLIDEYVASKSGKPPVGITGAAGAPGGVAPKAKPKTLDEADRQSLSDLGAGA